MDPVVLDEQSLPAVARYIQSKRCKQVFVMTGAGLSTSAGIPDFRSPETGLYANLARLNLPYPEAVFDINFFRRNPLPFDTLERRAGLPDHKIVEAHGSFASQRCIDCKMPFDDDKMKAVIRAKEVPKCESCGGLVKPDIVFFGEALPPKFHKSIYNLVNADLLIILGTSLTVYPFASLTGLVPESCPRVLINLDDVGDIGSRPDDVLALGKCDEVVRELAQLLDWEHELDALWESTKDSLDLEKETPEADLEQEVKRLTDEVDKTLKLSAELVEVTKKIDKKEGEAGSNREGRDSATTTPSPEEGAKVNKDDKAPKNKELITKSENEAQGGTKGTEMADAKVPTGTEVNDTNVNDSEKRILEEEGQKSGNL